MLRRETEFPDCPGRDHWPLLSAWGVRHARDMTDLGLSSERAVRTTNCLWVTRRGCHAGLAKDRRIRLLTRRLATPTTKGIFESDSMLRK